MSPSSPAGSSSSSLPSSNTLLALPDGNIPYNHADLKTHTISLIGGYPTFPTFPSASKAPEEIRCGVCHQSIPLLCQVYCPPEGGENDRTLYVWGCSRGKCQRREGSIRAFRASVRNDEYVKDVEERRAVAEKEAQAEKERAKKNPFSMPDSTSGSSLFGSAQPLFGGSAAANPFASPPSSTPPPDISRLSISSTSPAPLQFSSTSTTHAPPIPAYQPAQYLSTIDEYLPPPQEMDVDEDDEDDDEHGEKAEFRNERWEQLLPKYVDEVFERFVKRLESAEGASGQVLRYELGGVPVPYSSSSPLFRKVFPTAPTTRTPDDQEEPDFAQYLDTSTIPPCPRCKGERIFELQLVPSLISTLTPDSLSTTGKAEKKGGNKGQSEEERKKELARLAGGDEGGEENGEMGWGSVVVFGCKGDCVGFGEEWVGVEWEALLSGS